MITSLANAKIKYVRRLQAEKRFRTREKAFVVEGTRWAAELVRLARIPELIFYTEGWRQTAANAHILLQITGPKQTVTHQVMAAISDTQTPPGFLAVLRRKPQALPDAPSLLLILDGVTNPGNLGTMLRSAGAAGAAGVLLGPGCVDAYNPKTVRGGMGAHLRLPIWSASWEQIAELTAKMSVWLATADGEIEYTAVPWTTPSALIIGGEAGGAGEKARKLATGTIAIPMRAATESLNAAVASAVILFEAARQRKMTG
ncbi:MAG: RNA methyltransferase [Chloroflexi bacterium]|nr:RNA methyltransferase [Chloroflexota bacterium]